MKMKTTKKKEENYDEEGSKRSPRERRNNYLYNPLRRRRTQSVRCCTLGGSERISRDSSPKLVRIDQ